MFFFIQSPTLEGKRQGGPDNPSLTDNWDDAEGYYRSVHTSLFYCCHCFNLKANQLLKTDNNDVV